MKKVIGIYCGIPYDYFWDEESVLEHGGGGSETWTVEIARVFQKKGFHVIVFGCPNRWKFAPSGVEYVPYTMFGERIKYQKFDYFISSRQVNELTTELSCPNVYIMSHDISLHFADTYDDLKLDRVRKIAYLSTWHKWALCDWYKMHDKNPDTFMFKTFNGVDREPYRNVDPGEKENRMVWSSRSERGLRFLLERVLPKIRATIPDFCVDVCLYQQDIEPEYFQQFEGVVYHGTVGKAKLAELQKKAKIWIYPNLGYLDTDFSNFKETFCITAVENGLAGNAIISSAIGGLVDTLDGYWLCEKFINGADEYTNGVINENLDEYASYLACEAVACLTNDTRRTILATHARNICAKYTWEESANTWLREWKLID